MAKPVLLEKLKYCPMCRTEKPVFEFPVSNARKDGRAAHCSLCRKTRYKTTKEQNRIRHMRNRYGIEIDHFEDMLDKQDGKCAICLKEFEGFSNAISIDRCHESGVVRGLLCRQCNLGLGNLGENLDNVKRAVEYLENFDGMGKTEESGG